MTKEEINDTRIDAADEQLLERFFQQPSRQTIADNGFTQRVMRQLPDRSLRLSRLWSALCVMAGVVLFVAGKGWKPIVEGVLSLVHTPLADIHPIPLFIAVGAICSVVLLELGQQSGATAST